MRIIWSPWMNGKFPAALYITSRSTPTLNGQDESHNVIPIMKLDFSGFFYAD